MKAKDYKDREAVHNTLGKCRVTDVPKRSKTAVDILVIDRGEGWDETSQSYKGVIKRHKDHVTWSRGQNRQFGHVDTVHIKTLELLPIEN